MVALTGLACCCEDPRFDDYVLIYDDAEHRNAFDLEYLFGSKFKARVVPPELGASDTVQKFKASVLNLFEQGKPFIYILDSYDALSSDEELEKDLRKALALAKSDEAAKKIAGSYNMEKAKIGGQIMRQIASRLHRTSSALLVVQQYRQNTNAAGPFDKKYITSGGEWPMYYSQMRPALAKIQTLKKTVNGKERPNGVRVRVGFEKNSVSGKMWPVEFDIYYDLGIDDVGSMVKFLVSEGGWPKKGGKIHAKELNIFSTMSKLIEEIEERGLERKVQRICGRCWKEICDKMRLGRKRRFE
jgi:RecA/RadA recombinase